MSNLWERFDGIVKAEEVIDAKAQYAPLEEGEHECILEEIKASESKSGLPMLKGKFRTKTNKVVFYNQVLQNINYPSMTAKNIALANDFVNALRDEDVEFTTLGELASRVESIETGGMYVVNVEFDPNNTEKKFPKLSIVENKSEYDFEDEETDF